METKEQERSESLKELRARMLPDLGDETDLAIESLIRYVAIASRIYDTVALDPERLARLDALTKKNPESTMTAERSFTNQYI
jgi:lipase chaperone LimK